MGQRALQCTDATKEHATTAGRVVRDQTVTAAGATRDFTVTAAGATKDFTVTAAGATKEFTVNAAHSTRDAVNTTVQRLSQKNEYGIEEEEEEAPPPDAADAPPPVAAAPAPPPPEPKVAPTWPCLETSQYKVFYTPTKNQSVTSQIELFTALEQFLTAYGKHNGFEQSAADECFNGLKKEIEESELVKTLTGQGKRLVAEIAVVLWSSALRDGFDREFCSILNHSVREDMETVLPSCVILCRAMATLIVPTRGTAVRGPTQGRTVWPKDWVTHRGTTMPREAVNFFADGMMYRAPMYLATSCQQTVATEFMERGHGENPDRVPVHFKFYINPMKKCDHVFYIEGFTQCAGEEELLYAPYSAFKVRNTILPDGEITYLNPIIVEIDVQPNNMNAKEDVPNSSWH